MRKLFAVAAASALTLAMSTTAFAAAWKQDKTGQWRYMTSDSTWLTSTTTPDGYQVDVNGYWNGQPSTKAAQQASGNAQDQGESVVSQYKVNGNRIFKITEASLDEASNSYKIKADLFDTAFKTNDEIKAIKKGDTVELPGVGKLTAENNAGRGVLRASNTPKKDGTTPKESGYSVRLTDASGNHYMLSAQRLRKTNADNSTSEVILRPVATGIELTLPTYRSSQRVNGTSHYSSTKKMIENKMMFEATLKGNEITELKDTVYNYDTTTTPVYSADAGHGHLANKDEY